MTQDQTDDTAASTGPGCIHDDILNLRELAQVIRAYPTAKPTAAAFEAVARIADDLAHRLDAIEAAAAQAKPCEGCGGAGEVETFEPDPLPGPAPRGGWLGSVLAAVKEVR